MYNERTNFSIRTLILQFLFLALFIFILIWLFPMKSDLKNSISNGSDLSVLYDRFFNENIISMKESAKSYYTTSRLPKNIGDKVKITLGEMLDKKIILPFADKDGNACNLNESYVEITKYDEEFIMKVNLKCGTEENYLLVYMGCYDYCSTAICETNKSDIKKPTIYPSNSVVVNNTNTNTNTNTNPPTTPIKNPEYLYEYKKTTDGSYIESAWSNWSTTEVSASSTVSVQIKTVTENKIIGYNVKTATDYSSPIYGTKELVIGTEEKQVCKKYDYVATGSYSYGDWVYQGIEYFTYSPNNTATVQYIKVDESSSICEPNCTAGTTTAYKKYIKTATAVTEYKCVEYGTEVQNIITTIQVITGYKTTIISKTPVYQATTVKYYSYKTRTYTAGTIDIKWSIHNDVTLIQSGYVYTGNTKQK